MGLDMRGIASGSGSWRFQGLRFELASWMDGWMDGCPRISLIDTYLPT